MPSRDSCNLNTRERYNDFNPSYNTMYSCVFFQLTCAVDGPQGRSGGIEPRCGPRASQSQRIVADAPRGPFKLDACSLNPYSQFFFISLSLPQVTTMCSSQSQLSSTPPASHHTANQVPPLPLIRCPECNAGYVVWFVSGIEENPGRYFYKCERH